jgi:hypothetical protein
LIAQPSNQNFQAMTKKFLVIISMAEIKPLLIENRIFLDNAQNIYGQFFLKKSVDNRKFSINQFIDKKIGQSKILVC